MSQVIAKMCGHLKRMNGIQGVFTHMTQNPTFPYITIDFKNIQRGQGDSSHYLCRTETFCLKIFSRYQGIKEIVKLTDDIIEGLDVLDLSEVAQFVSLKLSDVKISSLKEGTHMSEFYIDVLMKS